MSEQDRYSMVQECTDQYEVRHEPDGGVEIRIKVPERFADLWISKLSGLRTDDEEIAEYVR